MIANLSMANKLNVTEPNLPWKNQTNVFTGNQNLTGNLSVNGGYICNETACYSLADLNTSSSGGVPDYSNIALTNQSQTLIGNQTIQGNVTLSGLSYWFVGLFNLFESIFGIGSSTNEILFNGSTIAFNETYNNRTISTIANISVNQYLTNANASYLDTHNASYDSFNSTLNIQRLYNTSASMIANLSMANKLNVTDPNLAWENQSNTFAGNQNISGNLTVQSINISDGDTTSYVYFKGGGYIYDNTTTLILGHS
jgi:hypothetical protein